jgi:uncharacterized protein YraI
VVVNTDGEGLNLRARPGNGADILGVVPEGAVIQEQTSKIDGWVKTTYNGITGYLWYGFLRELGDRPSSPARPRLSPGSTAVISGTPGALNLRTGPSMDAKIITKMWEGWEVRITGVRSGGWYPVAYTDGLGRTLKGWAWGKFLQPGTSNTARTLGATVLTGALGLPAWGLRRRRRRQNRARRPGAAEGLSL